ncbi:ABC transporter permease subunit [Ruania alba]|uniref:ABC-2 type transport system permease protein n=1 Tax=Ruania alba TaxID=648782 RepID=A0A1H5N6K9_9MICO|nr:ABC transporter permease subunit [Ruania alba]SEE96308.1 ABC-2 type transport system permease protein [Ruania alba]
MTAVATEPRNSRHSDSLAGAHVNFARVLRSEWIKLTTLRSTPWTVAVTIVLMVLISLGMAWGMSQSAALVESGELPPEAAADMADPTAGAFAASFGYSFGQIVVIVLGVLIISGEYATGQIKSSIAAVPHRWPLLAAKGVIVALVALVTGAVGVALAYLVTTPMLEPHGMAADLGDPDHLRILLGAPLYLAVIALLALGVGALLRHAAAAISAVLGLILVLPILPQFITLDWLQDIAPYFPSTAGERIMGADTGQEVLTPWEGLGVLGLFVAAVWIVAIVLLRRRDA